MKLSKVSKLDGIRSWSLQARETCPGSYDNNGQLVPACQGCYAVGGRYVTKNVRKPREFNRTDWQRSDWVADMVAELANDRFFRWFDSGDIYHPELARKILQVMQQTPWVKHWLPTRSHKLARIKPTLEIMRSLPNVSVRYSADDIDGTHGAEHGSTIVPDSTPRGGLHICEAYNHGGKCNGCRACWDKNVPVIGYVAHGRTMAKVIRIHSAAA